MTLRHTYSTLPAIGGRRNGFTLVEILVATTLTLILMTAVVTVFGGVGDGISKSRRALDQFDRLRTVAQQLRTDLSGITVKPIPPARPEENPGYLEILTVGNPQIAAKLAASFDNDPTKYYKYTTDAIAVDANNDPQNPDATVGKRGDILMFTTRNIIRPFTGRYQRGLDGSNPTLQSDVAEIAWFLRGTTLYRRVLLVAPGTSTALAQYYTQSKEIQASVPLFFQTNDISVRLATVQVPNVGVCRIPVPNTLADLTKRENRFAHPADVFPFDIRRWGLLGLPTLAECTSPWFNWNTWTIGTTPVPPVVADPNNWPAIPFNHKNNVWRSAFPPINNNNYTIFPNGTIDLWGDVSSNVNQTVSALLSNPAGQNPPGQYLNSVQLNSGAASPAQRLADDVVLTNVVGFDVKVWDPGAPLRVLATSPTVTYRPGEDGYLTALLADPSSKSIVGYGAYVDLGWRRYDPMYYRNIAADGNGNAIAPIPKFWTWGDPGAGMDETYLNPNNVIPGNVARVYDVWSNSYENEGIYYFGLDNTQQIQAYVAIPGGRSTNGLDDSSPPLTDPTGNSVTDGVADDASELITAPPYPFLLPPAPPPSTFVADGQVKNQGNRTTPTGLRGIQVKIRCFEPASRQVREITIEQDFLPK